MTGLETNFNLKAWKSRVLQIATEITGACGTMPDSLRKDRMIEAMLQLGRVANRLDFARAIPGDPHETALLLTLSVQECRQNAERKRCEQIGGGVPSESETAHALENVSRFPKPSISTSNGE